MRQLKVVRTRVGKEDVTQIRVDGHTVSIYVKDSGDAVLTVQPDASRFNVSLHLSRQNVAELTACVRERRAGDLNDGDCFFASVFYAHASDLFTVARTPSHVEMPGAWLDALLGLDGGVLPKTPAPRPTPQSSSAAPVPAGATSGRRALEVA